MTVHELLAYLGPMVPLAGLLLAAPKWAFRIESAVQALSDTSKRLEESEARTVARLERLAESHTITVARLERLDALEERIAGLEAEGRSNGRH